MSARQTEPELCHARYRGVRLADSDLPACRALSDEAQWNQTENDWRFLLSTGHGFGFEDSSRALAASAVVLPYGRRIAWIGMVLVSAPARRQGLATLLLRHCLAWCRAQGFVPLLDATPAGRPVYVSLGFADVRKLTRWRCAPAVTAPAGWEQAPFSGKVGTFALDPCVEWDEPRFGADRRALLRMLEASHPDLALQLVGSQGELRGYCLGRTGRAATQIGPVMAETEMEALELLEAALYRTRGPVLLDAPDGRMLFERALKARGFQPERPFTRMACGSAEEYGRPGCVFAIAGPELG